MTTLDLLKQEIENTRDIHEAALAATEGGGSFEIPEGTALAVCTGYVETGSHENSKGKSNPRAKLFFELFDLDDSTSDYTRSITVKDEDGKDVKKTVGSPIAHNLNNISRNDKAMFRKDIDAMLEAVGLIGQTTSPMDLIGKTFMVDVVHNQDPKDEKRKYTNLEVAQAKPAYECNRAGKPDMTKPLELPVDVSELQYKLFVFDAPTPVMWSTIFIEGETEVEGKDGKKEMKSKNWIQELIKSADNFAGSAVESMLLQNGNTSTPLPKAKKAKEATQEDVPADAPVKKVAEKRPEKAVEAVSEPTGGLSLEEQEELIKMRDVKGNLESCGLDTSDVDEKIAALEAKQ